MMFQCPSGPRVVAATLCHRRRRTCWAAARGYGWMGGGGGARKPEPRLEIGITIAIEAMARNSEFFFREKMMFFSSSLSTVMACYIPVISNNL